MKPIVPDAMASPTNPPDFEASLRTLSGKARLAGALGWPVSHSLSPTLHGYWLARHGIDGAYVPLPVRPEHFDRAVRGLALAGFAGFNVTVPHKEAALSACDTLDDAARRIGAVNTIVVSRAAGGASDGVRLEGRNTDGFGFIENLRALAPAVLDPARAQGACAVVIGAGGAARAVCDVLIEAGFRVALTNRTADRARSLASRLGPAAQAVGWDERGPSLTGAALVVNTTSLGMAGQPPLELDLALLPSDAVVADIVYVPLETDLLKAARARGNPVVDGLGMLLHQGRAGFHAWFGTDPVVDEPLRRFMLAALAQRG